MQNKKNKGLCWKKERRNSKNKKSKFKAFDKEFSNLKIFMSKNDNYVEFLKYIGLTDTEIDLYGKWDPQDDENIS